VAEWLRREDTVVGGEEQGMTPCLDEYLSSEELQVATNRMKRETREVVKQS
jgi:hypothetical protein